MTRPLIGLDMFHYVEVTDDSSSATTYDTSVHVPNITQANINFNAALETFFADDGPREVYTQIGEVDLEINVADLPPEDYAFLIGAAHTDGVVSYASTAYAPEVAVAFRAQKSNGEYRYIWLTKGKFGVPSADHQTKEAGVNFQPQTISGKFVARLSDDMVFRRADSDDGDLTATALDLLADWFDGPDYTPTSFNITNIEVNEGTLVFNEGVREYDVSVGNLIAAIEVTVTSTEPALRIAGGAATSGTGLSVDLGGAGSTTVIPIEIEETGGEIRTYTVNVHRAAA